MTSKLILQHSDQGCPSTCAESPAFRAPLASLHCSNEVIGSLELQKFGEALRAGTALWHPEHVKRMNVSVDALNEAGCESVYNHTWNGKPTFSGYMAKQIGAASMGLCDRKLFHGWRLKPLTHLCPESCGCASSFLHDPEFCPAICRPEQ